MSTFNAINRKNNAEVVAVELETGRFQITEAGNVKEVAASTFKRWYSIVSEVEVATSELDSLLEGAEEVEASEEEAKPEIQAMPIDYFSSIETADGKKCEKVVTVIAYSNVNFIITEYDGYVCDVELRHPITNELQYKSPKMSMKDALENGLGLEGEALKSARRQLMSIRKAARN